jgi:hypothetical protein
VEPTWHVIGASVQGTSHIKNDVPCQDMHGCCVLPGGVALVAVADGAGSAERSDEGARRAVEVMLTSLEAALQAGMPDGEATWGALLAEAFCQAQRAVIELAEAEDASPRAFATTLTCAVAADEWLATGQIGDGIVVAKGDDGEFFAATLPQHGEYANETFFLTMEEALQQVEIHVYPRSVSALAVMTDGLIRLAIDVTTNEPYRPFFQPLLAFAAQAANEQEAHGQLAILLASERVNERTDDDKTIVLVARPTDAEIVAMSEKDATAR